MKIFSLPVLAAGIGTILVGGGLIYAFSSPHQGPVKIPQNAPVVAAAPEVPEAMPRDQLPLTTDPSGPASAPASASTPGNHPASATDGTPGTPGAGHARRGNGQRMKEIYDQLGLTPEQQQQIADIRAMSTDRDQRRQALMLVLTPEQRTQYQQLRTQMQSQRGNGQTGGAQGQAKAKP